LFRERANQTSRFVLCRIQNDVEPSQDIVDLESSHADEQDTRGQEHGPQIDVAKEHCDNLG
jgi:hypothetical protein